MPLTFYYGSGSPYAWRVWLALEHKQIAYALTTLSFSSGDLRKPEYLAINPRHRVPAIVDDGFALYESAAVVEYLDEKYPGDPKLLPGDLRQRATIRRMVREVDQYYVLPMERMVDQILFTAEDKWDEEEIKAARKLLVEEIDRWEEGAGRTEYLGATAPTAVDFALYPLIALTLRMEKKKADLGIRSAIGPQLGAWMTRVESLPYFKKTWPPHWK
jgi:glutathione S-transferase